MKRKKPKLISLDIALSNRLRIQLQEKFAQVSDRSPLKELVNLVQLCDNYIGGNEVHKHPTIKANVRLVKDIRRKTWNHYNAKKP
jgi:hypothetical protein